DAIELMAAWSGAVSEAIHLVPMFPHRQKSALAKKEMRLIRPLAGDDLGAPQLLPAALPRASHREAGKRPRKARIIEGPRPSSELTGQSSRYDIYSKRRLEAD